MPDDFLGTRPCYVTQVSGDSMIEEGVFNGDYMIIEQQDTARNGEIVVALINNAEVTLKKIEQKLNQVILYPANSEVAAMIFTPDQIQIQGVLRGLIRSYR